MSKKCRAVGQLPALAPSYTREERSHTLPYVTNQKTIC